MNIDNGTVTIPRYVLGFMFSDSYDYNSTKICVIQKKRPKWQKGLYNGVGGKSEPNEMLYDAMVREFKQETGVLYKDWKSFGILYTHKFFMKLYVAFTNEVFKAKTIKDEIVEVIYIKNVLSGYPIVNNLKWLIPLAYESVKGNTTEYFNLYGPETRRLSENTT